MKKMGVFIVTVLLIFSCNDAEKKPEEKKATKIEAKKEIETKTKPLTTVNEVMLHSNDQMQFDKKEIRVKAGNEVTLTLKHTGKMAKTVMGHNFVLLNKDVNLAKFAEVAITAKDNEYVPKDSKDVLAYTKIIGGGESVTITFNAPEKGTYDFLCSFPGHYAMMKGKFIVE